MGDDDMTVIDERLAVHGVDRLPVVDASIMPTTTSGNTDAPRAMIAEKSADDILGASIFIMRARKSPGCTLGPPQL